MEIKLSADEMRYIALFESVTGARVRDCVIDEEGGRLIFVVNQGELGLAVGKGGCRIREVRRLVGKGVEAVEYSDDPAEFVKNAMTPARIKEVQVIERGGQKVALVSVEESDKGLAIGKGGKRLKRAKMLALRHHGIQDVRPT